MKIKSFRIKNFRGYIDSGVIKFDALTAFIGKNDAGKSTVLDALNIFFNTQKMDKDDINVQCRASGNLETVFDVCFCELPQEIDIDAGGKTTLKGEYLLRPDGCLEVIMKFVDASKPKFFVFAKHPSNPECCDLLKKKIAELKKVVKELEVDCDQTRNASMRMAIWAHFADDLQLTDQELQVDVKDGEIKAIWEKLHTYLPVYSLFKSDRSNDDKDDEIQDPLKIAVKEVVKEARMQEQLSAIAKLVKDKLDGVASRTLAKVREAMPSLASSLHPKLPSPKWEDLFKGISITGDQDIPLAKRGSGVRRLILMSFFRAEAERRKAEKGAPDVIYAIEEPETSQHADFQAKIIDALKNIAKVDSVQVVLTTHSSIVVKSLGFETLRVIKCGSGGTTVGAPDGCVLPYHSLNEVSYLAFDQEASVEYHDELYGHLVVMAEQELGRMPREGDFEKWLENKGVRPSETWKRNDNKGTYPCTLQTFVRNRIHHPENQESQNRAMKREDILKSIKEMRALMCSESLPKIDS